jgi:TonB family protein
MKMPPPEEEPPESAEKEEPAKPSTPPEAPNTDRNALALNNATATAIATPEPTPTPTPQPIETPEPTMQPTPEPTPRPTAQPKRQLQSTMRPQPTPRAEAHKHNRHLKPLKINPKPKVMLALRTPIPHAVRTPSVVERLAKLRQQLMKEHLQQLAKMEKARQEPETDTGDDTGDDNGDDGTAPPAHGERANGGGPVAGNSVTNGHGYGVGSGSGSLGILRDPEFLLYYQKVQERIKDAWSFAGGSRDLTTTVNFAIGPDGRLAALQISQSSNNASFDQSVLRAIRRAAPFPPPPEHYRDQFAQGVQAVFELGELRS